MSKHEVRVEAAVKNSPNDSEQTGSLKDEFDATGFAPGCDPTAPPSFDVTKGDLLAPPAPVEKDKGKKLDVKASAHVTVKATAGATAKPAGAPHLPPPPPPESAPAASPPSPPPATPPPQDFTP